MVYYLCTKCKRIIRQCNADKHMNKCKESVMQCCDCGNEIKKDEVMKHSKCTGGAVGSLPSLFNPNARVSNANTDMLRVIDRAEAENKEENRKDCYRKLCCVDCLPQKKEGFVKFVVNLCKLEASEAEAVWSTVERIHEKQKEEKQLFTSTLKEMRNKHREKKDRNVPRKGGAKQKVQKKRKEEKNE